MLGDIQKLFPLKYVIGVIVFSFSFILIIGLFFTIKAPKISEEAYGAYYTIEGIEIPTITAVINDKRKVAKMSIGTSKTKPYKSFTYSDVVSIKSDIKSYIDYLIDDDGFELESEENVDSVLWKVVLSKYDDNIKKNLFVKIKCDVNNYTITIKTTEENDK